MSIPIPSSQTPNNALVDAFVSYSHSQTFRCDSALEATRGSKYPVSQLDTPSVWDLDPEVGMGPSLSPGGGRSITSSPDLRRGLHLEQSPLLDSVDEVSLAYDSNYRKMPVIRKDTPLRTSSSNLLVPRPSYGSFQQDRLSVPSPRHYPSYNQPRPLVKNPSFPSSYISGNSGVRTEEVAQTKEPNGSSTYGQTLFNAIAVLVGVGILSEPLAFASAGWLFGTFLIIFYGALSCYTAKILGRIMLSDRSLQTYADIGRKAFGPRTNALTSFLFCLELFCVSCVFVTLAADSLNSMFPILSSNMYKLLGIAILFPTMFIPLRLISYASAVGIVSTVSLIFVVFFDGFSKPTSPGSLYEAAPTDLLMLKPMKLGAAFGLFMSGFSGHAVFPSLGKDMAEPHRFDHMVNRAFLIATLLYGLIGAAGYIMFGREVSDEISLDLLHTPGYNRLMNQIAIWMLVISPLTKFPLTTRPLTITIEVMLGLDKAPKEEEKPKMEEVDSLMHSNILSEPRMNPNEPLLNDISTRQSRHPSIQAIQIRRILRGLGKLVVASLVVAVSILVPQFSSLMAFLGAFSAFTICIIGPVMAKIALDRRCGLTDALILAVVIPMTVWGTYVSCNSGGSGL